MITLAVVGPSDISACSSVIGVNESVLRDIATDTGGMLAKQRLGLVAVPYKGIGYYAAKGYVNAGGKSLCSILPTGITSEITANEVVGVGNWVKQPEALVSKAKIMIVVGMSAGTLIEICMTKRFKKYPVIVYKNLLSYIPKEVERELNIQYITNRQALEVTINGLTKKWS